MNRTIEAWERDGRVITRRHEATPWLLGDWLAEGRELGFDTEFEQSVKVTGYSKDYLYSLRLTAEAFPQDVRSKVVAWGVHRELSRIKDKQHRLQMLQQASELRWTQHDARTYMRNHGLVGVRKKEVASPNRNYKPVEVKCPSCGHVFPVKDHKYVGENV